jgi:hypothetical protein
MTWCARQDGHGQIVRPGVRASKAGMAGLDSCLGLIAKILEPWETKFHDLTCGVSMRAIGGSVNGFGVGVESVDDVQSMDDVAPVPIVQQ